MQTVFTPRPAAYSLGQRQLGAALVLDNIIMAIWAVGEHLTLRWSSVKQCVRTPISHARHFGSLLNLLRVGYIVARRVVDVTSLTLSVAL